MSTTLTQRGITAALIFATALCMPSAFGAQDVKPAHEVFVYEARASGSDLVVDWDIAPKHYLYRDKMSFKSPDATLGKPVFPPGEVHADEFFGEQIIFRDRISVRVPVESLNPGVRNLKLELRSQGCADRGLCYPPQKWEATVAMPVTASSDTAFPLGRSSSSAAQPDTLPASEAFSPDIVVVDPFTVDVTWTIAPDYYLYKKDFAFANPSGDVQLGNAQLPTGVVVDDLEFGEVEVYFDTVTMRVPFTRASPKPRLLELELFYQGCKKDSICYPPDSVIRAVDLPRATANDTPPRVSEQDRLFDLVANGSLLSVMFAFMGFGLLLAFTPCCLPMVPILSGVIAGQGENTTTLRSFWLSVSYVLGMAFTYTIAGAAVGAAGGRIQAALQTPLILGAVALLFVVLSLAMFGVYELQMPAAVQTRLTALGNKGKAGSFMGVAFLGAISALVVSTCVAPPLVAALAVIAQIGDVARGAFALFALSIGMGIPLIVYGTSAGKLLPKAGAWMNTVKAVFGFMLLGLAIWMLDRVLPGLITMLLWAALAIFAGVWFGALTSLGKSPTGGQLSGKAVGLVSLVYGVVLLVGALSGSQNPLQPLDRLTSNGEYTEHALPFVLVKSVEEFEAQRLQAAAEGKNLMLDFYADWCVSCKEMEAWTFTDEKVQQALENAVLIQADVTANDDVDQALLKRFGIFGPPTIVFFDRNGNEVQGERVIGYMNTEAFLDHLDYVLR